MGVFGYIGKGGADETHIDDKNIGADTEDTPPEYEDPFEGEGNYPSQVFFHQQRLGFAASNSRPITIWLSRSGEFESMAKSTPPKDDDAIEVTLAATQASRIVWLQPDRSALAFGTEGSEWTLEPSEGVADPGHGVLPAPDHQRAAAMPWRPSPWEGAYSMCSAAPGPYGSSPTTTAPTNTWGRT